MLAELLDDVHTAGIADKMKPVLDYVKKLTLIPSKITEADAVKIFAAGWNETALYHAVSVCAMFNFMNRFVEGLGIHAGKDYYRLASQRLSQKGYSGLAKVLGAAHPET